MIKGDTVAKSDGDGLTFTLSNAGTASWVLRYRLNGRRKEVTLGKLRASGYQFDYQGTYRAAAGAAQVRRASICLQQSAL